MKHPGILHNAEDLNFMKTKVINKEGPWLEAYQLLLTWEGSSLNWTPTPYGNVHRDGYGTNIMHSNGNWGLSMVNSAMAIAVFCDDTAMFNGAVKHVMLTSFRPYSTLSGYIDSISGQSQESGHDQGHTQMGLGYLVSSCEIAWKQSIDLYAYLDNRLLHGIEYTAKYNLGYEVPYYNMYYKFDWVIAEKGRGNFAPIYERMYNHYVNRRLNINFHKL